MRRARSVMSSRLPMGVPTRYKQPRAVFVSTAAAPLMLVSLARTAETICDACYTFLFGDSAEGVAVPLYEYKCLKCAPHGENRAGSWPALEEVPALRRESGIGDHRAGDQVQGFRVVCYRLRGKIYGRRKPREQGRRGR